jgi:Uma2 family endonuclease
MSTAVSTRPSLESGDRMEREEFHRRYEQRPDIHRAELVEGVVYVPSPMRINEHERPAGLVYLLLATYEERHPGCLSGHDGTVILDGESEVQPDAYLYREEPGGPRIGDDGYLHGGPQLVVEVAASTVSRDLHDKFDAYRRNGVREYIVWRVLDRAIDFFELVDGEYVRRQPDPEGVIESKTFPGLRFDVETMLAGDRSGALAALR